MELQQQRRTLMHRLLSGQSDDNEDHDERNHSAEDSPGAEPSNASPVAAHGRQTPPQSSESLATPSTVDATDAASEEPATTTGTARGRPRMHGTGRKANRSLRMPVTYAHKLSVINFYDSHERDINATVKEFYSHLAPAAVASRKRQIYKWVKERPAIEEMCFKQATAGQSRRREKGTATTLGTQGEAELVLWIQAIQRAGKDAGVGEVSTQTVKSKAMEIAAKYGVPAGSFQATWSWQQGFYKRHQDAISRF